MTLLRPLQYFARLLALCTACVIFLIFFSCDSTGTHSGGTSQFSAGTYSGTYKVIQNPRTAPVVKVDTVIYKFGTDSTFRMTVDSVDQQRRFCDVISGKYIYYGDSLRTQNVVLSTTQICDPNDKPQSLFYQHSGVNSFVFRDNDTLLERTITLWVK